VKATSRGYRAVKVQLLRAALIHTLILRQIY
jgi:hypothetical protein